MLAEILRKTAFWASLLLCLCMLEARLSAPSKAESVGAVLKTHVLRVTVSVLKQEDPALQGDAALKQRDAVGDKSVTPTLTIFRQVPGVETATARLLPRYEPIEAQNVGAGQGVEFELVEGEYWVLARAEGYARVARPVRLKGPQSLELTLSPSADLLVRVLAEQSGALLPLLHATVLVGEPDELPLGAFTDKKGEVTFKDTREGAQTVRIFAPGFEPYEGKAERELVVRLRPASTILVRVLREGKPHPGADVVIAGVRLWPSRTVQTGPDGTVRLSGLKPGTYALYAESGSLLSAVTRDVPVLSEPKEHEVILHLKPGLMKAVQVVDEETKKPIALARATYSTSALGEFSRRSLSDAAGQFMMGPLEVPRGVVSVRAVGYVARVIAFGEAEFEAVGPLVIELARSARVEGRVVDERGFPVAGATVEVVGTDLYGMPVSVTSESETVPDAHFDWSLSVENVLIPAGELGVMLGPVPPIPLTDLPTPDHQRLFTDKRGQFVVTGVPPGQILVVARHPDYLDGKSAEMTLGPGGERSVEVVLKSGLPLRGRVLDHLGFPVSEARVRVLARGFDRRVSAESDGTFSLGAAPKDITLTVSRPEQPLRVLLSVQVTREEREQEVALSLPKPREPVDILVVDERGEPIALAQVKVTSLEPSVPFKETRFTSDRGVMQLEEARGLRAVLSVSAPEYVEKETERVLKAESKIVLLRALSVTGRVMGVSGRLPAGGALVRFESDRLVRTTVADEYGEFRLTGVPPGRGVLSASHEEYGKGQRAVSVASRDPETPVNLGDLEVLPALTVLGRVETPSGEGLGGVILSADRISPFVPAGGGIGILGRSEADGSFEIEVPRQAGLYLYGALPGRAFGFSDAVPMSDRDAVEGVLVIIDHEDAAPADEQGTVLVGLMDDGDKLLVYAVARGSQAFSSGIREEDVLVSVDGHRPRDLKDARALLSGMVGSDVRLVLRRGGAQEEVLTPREPFLRR